MNCFYDKMWRAGCRILLVLLLLGGNVSFVVAQSGSELIKITTDALPSVTFTLGASSALAEFQIVGAKSQTVTGLTSRGIEHIIAPAVDGTICIYGTDASKLTRFDINKTKKGVTDLDLSGGIGLTYVSCNESKDLITLKMPEVPTALTYLSCYTCPSLTAIDVKGCANLVTLTCNNDTSVVSLVLPDVKNKLETVGCTGLAYPVLDFSEYTVLRELTCGGHKELTKIKISPTLRTLTIQECPKLTALDFSDATKLSTLNCNKNPLLSSLLLPAKIGTIDCSQCNFTTLDLSAYSLLRNVTAHNNPLTNLVLPEAPEALNLLSVHHTSLEMLDVTAYPKLYTLECGYNPLLMELRLNKGGVGKLSIQNSVFTELDLKGCANLHELQGAGCCLAEVDVTGCTLFKTLILDESRVQRVIATGCPAFNWLKAESCSELESIDVSGCSKITRLWCFVSPKLTSLKVDGCVALKNLRCGACALTELDITDCTALTELFECQNNRFTPDRLPRPATNLGEHYAYAPQTPLSVPRHIPEGTDIDFSAWAAMTAPGASTPTPTAFVWRRADGTLLTAGTDYSETDGHFTFPSVIGDSMRCEMTNAAFPDFKGNNVLRTIYTRVEGTFTVDGTQQKAVYDGRGHVFEVKPSVSGLTGFSTTYRVAGSGTPWEATVPTQAGEWDVRVECPVSDFYTALDVTIPAGLRIDPADVTLTLPTVGLIACGAALRTLPLTGGTALRSGSTDVVAGTFGWTDGSQTVTADSTFDVTFTPTDTKNYRPATGTVAVVVGYPVTVVASEHGTLTADPTFCALGTLVTLTATADRGYALASLSWNDHEEASGSLTFTMPAAPVEVKAVFGVVSYTVSYNLDGGTNYSGAPSSYTMESPSIILGTPTREGYIFAGWWDAAEGGTEVTGIAAGSVGDIMLYARWTAVPLYEITCTQVAHGNIEMLVEGHLVVSGTKLEEGTSVTLTATADRGYALASLSWNDHEEASDRLTFTMPAAPVEVKAVFGVVSYTVSYNLDGGTNYSGAPSSYTIESPSVILGTPTREGYIFAGWWDTAEGGTEVTGIAAGSVGDIMLYAHWTAVPLYEIIYEQVAHGRIEIFAEGRPVVSGTELEKGMPLIITTVPDLYYSLANLTVNGKPFISGNEYILMGSTTVKAVFELTDELPEAVVVNAIEVRGNNNTLLRILGRERYTSVRMRLFNVQGKLVYSHNNYLEDECDLRNYPRGAYYYVIEAMNVYGKKETLKGSVEVIR